MQPLTREAGMAVWGLAIVLAALVLGFKDVNPIPWALAVLGAVPLAVGIAVMLLHHTDDLAPPLPGVLQRPKPDETN